MYNYAMSLFEKQETDEGLRTLEKAAEAGNAEAQFQLASLIRDKRISRSDNEMIKWYTMAANQNHVYAINNLALCYQQGIGVECDLQKAFYLLCKAFSLGDSMAGFNIGQAYWFGLGVAQDTEKGLDYVKNAAMAGCPNAQYMLGQLYEVGFQDNKINIAVNEDEAILWYGKAASQKDELSLEALERLGASIPDDNPIIAVLPSSKVVVRSDLIYPDKYTKSDRKYIIADDAVPVLKQRVLVNSSKKAQEVLYELAGNYMNKKAFNALYELGKMADATDDNTRRGYAEFMFHAWKSFDIEKLKTMAFWSYPSFEYSEYDCSNQLVYKTTSEGEFVNHLIEEMYGARKNRIPIKMRLHETDGKYMTDVMVGTKVSTFTFLFGEKTFIGIQRYYLED